MAQYEERRGFAPVFSIASANGEMCLFARSIGKSHEVKGVRVIADMMNPAGANPAFPSSFLNETKN